ncbi:ATPase 2, putative [Eimeria tenella]|uniref:ATPase 2, putative n=1 Tax=Eimeria tenella TaxID=5802 RepID=U6L5V9_EIMTE|nr:ATPase 2, putative [Eimeria tenella]CDJ44583.1 ATPase 2, putative [Eimeria tenella]|eukprot:XP_013235331.1 ATPase 2, putative [Eimeria tenella]
MLIHVGFQDDSSSSPAAAATSSSSSNSSSSSSNGGSTRGGPSGLKGKIILLTKGADTVILPLLKQVGPVEERMVSAMESYAREGLRTLCIAYKEIKEKKFIRWLRVYEEAQTATVDRQEKIEKAAEMLENDLELQGITGLEDKLQEGVGETIEKLRHAGIKVWMLTGDKVETALNIAVATSLLPQGMRRLSYLMEDFRSSSSSSSSSSKELLLQQLQQDLRSIAAEKRRSRPTFAAASAATGPAAAASGTPAAAAAAAAAATEAEAAAAAGGKEEERALVIDGEALVHLLEDDVAIQFAAVCTACKTVICSRVTPYQKGAVVALLKKLTGEVTLAIGDGANDCSMIQAADVGVGLRGEEGMQAFNASDYGLSQFRYLQPLLLAHGRWNYRRVCRLVLYMFYKNLVLVLPMFFYGAFSLFSSQKFYFELLYQMYNVVFTAGLRAGWVRFGLTWGVQAIIFALPLAAFGYYSVPTLQGQVRV